MDKSLFRKNVQYPPTRFFCLIIWLFCLPQFTVWGQVSVKLLPSEGEAFDYFGESVAIDGDYAVIGSWLDDNDNGKDAGSARVYRRVGAVWEEQAILLAADGEAGDQFGFSVGINGEFAFVGAHRDDNENGPLAGSVYIFARDGGNWTQVDKLIANDGELEGRFGAAMASRGSRLVVGSPGAALNQGAAYVYHNVGSSWLFVNKIQASNGSGGDQFGNAVHIEEEYAVIGAPNRDAGGLADAGAAYTFAFSGTEWIEQAELVSPDAITAGTFGHSVALTANTAFIGAPMESVLGQQEVGSVYVFTRSGTTWSFSTKLTAFDGVAGDEFGSSVDALGEYAVVGARWHRNSVGARSGAAYLFRFVDGNWQSEARLQAADGDVGDQFGSAIAFNNEQVLVGARWDDNEWGRDAGGAYIFPVGGSGVPSLLADRSRLDFGTESIGEDEELTISIVNNGTADLNVSNVRIEGADASNFRLVRGGNPALLAPLAVIEMVVEFMPLNPGVKEATLVVESNSPTSPERIALSGEGVEGLQPGVARVIASRGGVATSFGSTVAVHGNYAIVGAEGQRDNEPGAAYIFERVGAQWIQQARITALDGMPGDRFGSAVSISNTHAIVGAWSSDEARGAAYVFIKSGSAWIQQAKLTASDGLPDDQFGQSVSIDGEFALAGAWQNDNERGESAGAAYVYRLSGNEWVQYVKLLAPDGEQGDRFGSAVSISGDKVLAGAANGGFFGEGRAYAFVWQDPIWVPDGVLEPVDAGLSDGFGSTVAIANNIAVVGSPLHDRSAAVDEGAAYVFQQDNSGTWLLRSKLRGSDGTSGFEFGASVSIQGDEVIVGAPGADNQRGAVYTFLRSGLQWLEQVKLTPPGGQDGEGFGSAIGYVGQDLIIGAPENENINGPGAGIAYLFSRSISTWSFGATLLATNRVIQPLFGSAVAVNGDLAVVGAQGRSGDTGGAYVFQKSTNGWTQSSELIPSDGTAGDLFGRSVAIDENYIVVGAPGAEHAQGTGAVYVFLKGSEGWSEQVRLVASDGAAQDSFGMALAIAEDRIAVGAPYADLDTREDAGKVFVFETNGPSWQEQAMLVSDSGDSGERLGMSLAMESSTLAVGAPGSTSSQAGEVAVFEYTGFDWVQEATLRASDGVVRDMLGIDVDLNDNYILAGAAGKAISTGAAYVFRRTSGVWAETEESKIDIIGGTTGDRFGHAVALSGNFALVGSPSAENEIGAGYLFERDGITWLQQSKLIPVDGNQGDFYGQAVDLDGDDALIGASFNSNGNGFEAGAVYILSITGTVTIVSDEEEVSLVEEWMLGQNYPNPASRQTTIPFQVEDPGHVRITLYDMLGRRVALLEDTYLPAGSYNMLFNIQSLSAGSYIYRMETAAGYQTRSLTVIR